MAGGGGGSFVTLGIDNLRYLNASRGSESCDAVVGELGSSLAKALPEGRSFHLGGDAFGFLVEGDAESGAATARLLASGVRTQPIGRPGDEMRVTVSAGVVELADANGSAAAALVFSDNAMARAKASGRDRVAIYDSTDASLATSAAWGENIREALERNALELHCEPVRSLSTGTTHWELLLRLPQTDGELLSPAMFLPLAKRFGLARALDDWVVQRAVELVAAGEAAERRTDLEINVSGESLLDLGFSQDVAARVEAAAIDPSSLIFEVSENDLGASVQEIRHAAARLRAIGCRFALDNFGSQHGSITQLKHLDVDFVKIDGAFIRHLADDAVDQMIVKTIVELVHALGSQVIAVHVGDEETVTLLESWGVDFVQGFHIGGPQPTSTIR
jgi:EAL domain-containing protein (putative c-di-GMP-specific phosphodiesterase class I)/GGDEF domain-containing protein